MFEKIPEKIDSKFRFVLLASCRAEQLMRGARAKLERPDAKNTRLAIEEILDDVVGWDYGPEEAIAEEAESGDDLFESPSSDAADPPPAEGSKAAES